MKTIIIIGSGCLVMFIGLGIISQNALPVILFRSALSSALVVFGYAGGSFLVKKYLPELLDGKQNDGDLDTFDSPRDGEPVTGRLVNYVIDGDGEQASSQTSPPKKNYQAMGDEDDESDNIFTKESSLSEVIEEVAENALESDSGGSSTLDTQEDDQEFREDAFYAGVDNLPDIAGFETTFYSEGSDDSNTSEDDFMPNQSSPAKSSGGNTGGMDPQLIAKAISTALKKGQ